MVSEPSALSLSGDTACRGLPLVYPFSLMLVSRSPQEGLGIAPPPPPWCLLEDTLARFDGPSWEEAVEVLFEDRRLSLRTYAESGERVTLSSVHAVLPAAGEER